MSVIDVDLPEGWITASIEDVCEIVRGITFPSSDKQPKGTAGTVACLRTTNVQDRLEWDDLLYVSSAHVKRNDQWLQHGDTVISMANSYELVGKVAFADNIPFKATFGGFLAVLRGRGIDSTYLFHLFRHPLVRDAIQRSASRTVNIANISLKGIGPIELPIAPVPEQTRIVAKIEALQSRSCEAREALEAIPPLLEQFRQSVLAAAFRGDLTADWREQNTDVEPASVLLDRIRTQRRQKWEEAELAKFKAKGKVPKDDAWKERYVEPASIDETNLPELPEGWCWASVDELSAVITSGSRDWTKYYNSGTGTFIMAQNVRPGKLSFVQGRQLVGPPLGDRDRERSQVLPGDLLITIVGANTGDICTVETDLAEHYVCQSVALIRLCDSSYAGWVMRYFLRGARGRRLLDKVIYGQGRPHLGFAELRQMPVPIPPQLEASILLPIITAREASIDSIEISLKAAFLQLPELDQAILAKAFRGELVPQDPNDEPASVFLKGLRTERELRTNEKAVRGRIKQRS